MMRLVAVPFVLALTLLAGCGGPRMEIADMTAARPADLQTTEAPSARPAEYRIGVGDKIDVRVFQVPDLSFEALVIDTSGNVQLP
jgi:protein involved in polysaccharide export with SLBB domain